MTTPTRTLLLVLVALAPALASAQPAPFSGRFTLDGTYDDGRPTKVRLRVTQGAGGALELVRTARIDGGAPFVWRSTEARLDGRRLEVRFAPETTRPAHRGLAGGVNPGAGGVASASLGAAEFKAAYRLDIGDDQVREVVLNLGADHWRWISTRGKRVGASAPALATRVPRSEHRHLLADLLGSVSVEGGLLVGETGGTFGLGVEAGGRLDMRKFLDAFPEFSGEKNNVLTFLGHTALMHAGIGFAFWAGEKLGVDHTWSSFADRNGGPRFDMAGGRFSWKDGNFGNWVQNGMGHPTVFFAASQYYKKLGYSDKAAWLGGLIASSMMEFFWEHYEKTPGVSGHDFWVMNLLGLTIGALSAKTLGEGRSVGLAVHLGGGRRYKLHSTMMEAYYEDANRGFRHSLLWSPNFSMGERSVPRAERPFMPYDVGYRFTSLKKGVYVGGYLELNNTATTGREFLNQPVRGVRVEVGVNFDLGTLIKKVRGR